MEIKYAEKWVYTTSVLEHIKKLQTELDKALAENARLKEAVKEKWARSESYSGGSFTGCNFCGGVHFSKERLKHEPDCVVLLAEGKE